MTEMNGKRSLFDTIGKPEVNKDMMLAKMAKLPKGYDHIGIANTEIGVTVVVASSDFFRPLVWEPTAQQWVELKQRTKGGVIV